METTTRTTTIKRFQIVGLVEVDGKCQYTITGKCLTPAVPVVGKSVHPECREAAWVRSRLEADARNAARRGQVLIEDDDAEEAPERASGVSDGNRKPGHERGAEVRTFLLEYDGRHQFLLDMKQIVSGKTKWEKLTDNQITAVAKFIDNATKPGPRPETGRDLRSVLPVGKTRAAVDNDSGSVTFFVIDNIDPKHDRWGSWVFVNQQQGGNDRIKVGSQRPGQTYTGNWANLIDRIIADPMAAVVRYGKELGVCGVCNTALTNEESREAGIGPVCARRLRESGGEE